MCRFRVRHATVGCYVQEWANSLSFDPKEDDAGKEFIFAKDEDWLSDIKVCKTNAGVQVKQHRVKTEARAHGIAKGSPMSNASQSIRVLSSLHQVGFAKLASVQF